MRFALVTTLLLSVSIYADAAADETLPKFVITTVAGDGTRDFGGDGGPSTEARISNPDIICFDQDDNLYIPDYMNSVVRKLTRVKPSV